MEALRKFVLRQNVVGMTTPPVLRGAQTLVGMTGASDMTAAARWGAVLGLTAFWFIEPYDFIRKTFNPTDEGAKPLGHFISKNINGSPPDGKGGS